MRDDVELSSWSKETTRHSAETKPWNTDPSIFRSKIWSKIFNLTVFILVCLQLALVTRYWTWMTHVATWGSILLFFLSTITFNAETWLVLSTVSFHIDYEQSLFPLKDSRAKRPCGRARRRNALSILAAHHSRVMLPARQAISALARVFFLLGYSWAERESARTNWRELLELRSGVSLRASVTSYFK